MRDGNLEKSSLATANRDDETFVESCGNVFADLGLPDPEIHLAKAELVLQLDQSIKAMKLPSAKAAKTLGLSVVELKAILRGQFRTYSIERLIHFLTRLNRPVDFSIRLGGSRPRRKAETRNHAMRRKMIATAGR